MNKKQMAPWPKGFRFHPSDEDIVDHYLEKKRLDHGYKLEGYIEEIELNEFEPEEIFGRLSNGDEECHFFTPRKLKYPKKGKTSSADRTTKSGYWKVTGTKHKVTNQGIKQIMVYHIGRPKKDRKTSWVIHEFERNDLKDFVLCRLHEKGDDNTNPEGESSANNDHVG